MLVVVRPFGAHQRSPHGQVEASMADVVPHCLVFVVSIRLCTRGVLPRGPRGALCGGACSASCPAMENIEGCTCNSRAVRRSVRRNVSSSCRVFSAWAGVLQEGLCCGATCQARTPGAGERSVEFELTHEKMKFQFPPWAGCVARVMGQLCESHGEVEHLSGA